MSTRAAAFVAVYLVLATIVASSAEETGITVSGHYEYSVYHGAAKPRYSATCNFRAWVVGRAWIISYENTGASTNASLLEGWTDASCDGTNIYVVHPQPGVPRKNALPVATGSVVATANIYSGDYPPPQEWTVRNIWLAFASSSVLGDAKGNAKPPFFVDLAVFYSTHYNCDYYWTTNETQPNCRELVFKSNGYEADSINGKTQLIKTPDDPGHTNGVGIWRQATNIAGVIVPTEFEFTAFSRRTKTELMIRSTYRCTVTNAGRAAIPSVPVPLPAGNVLVTDFRFDPSGRTHYLATGDWVRQIIDPATIPANSGIKLNIGDLAPDITFKTLEGKQLKLSDLRGKYVLLDFWATTCVPCVGQISKLETTYEAFGNDKRFAMLSLTSDAAEAETRRFIVAKGLSWTQGFLDEKSQSSVEQAYGFTGIPQVLLIGPDGKLVAKDLRGATMRGAVASALGSR